VRYDNATGRLTELLTPAVGPSGLSTAFRYDPAGNLVGVTDPQGNVVTYGYDGSGNRAFERDAAGNTTTRTYGPLNRVLTEARYRIADPDGPGPQDPDEPVTARYAYDAAGRTRFMVSAEGSVTENRYAAATEGYGLLRQTLLYIGQRYDVSGLSPTQQLTEAQLEAWVSGLPDRAQVQLTDYSYDLRGNVSQRISYATADAAGSGIRDDQASIAESFYDAQSRLQQQAILRGTARDQRDTVSSSTYDGITRVLETNGANGPETTVHDDANRRITLTRASGQMLDRLGRFPQDRHIGRR
jgi:YD repeat-containing protein